MDTRTVGILVGIVIGVVFVWQGALNAFFVALIVLAGWILAKIITGEIDLLDTYDRFQQTRPKRRR